MRASSRSTGQPRLRTRGCQPPTCSCKTGTRPPLVRISGSHPVKVRKFLRTKLGQRTSRGTRTFLKKIKRLPDWGIESGSWRITPQNLHLRREFSSQMAWDIQESQDLRTKTTPGAMCSSSLVSSQSLWPFSQSPQNLITNRWVSEKARN